MAKYHPIVILLFFIGVTSITMLIMHPVYLVISLGVACTLHVLMIKTRMGKSLLIYGSLFFSIALVNPLISQEGDQILFTLGSRVITLEAVCYGMVIAVMLIAVLPWFSCYNEVMTSDKFLDVFGKIVPTFALTVIITLRLVPRFQQQLQKIVVAQKAIGLDYRTGSIRDRLLCIVRMLSILMTWALENAVETADVMKARGYGLPGKSTFSNYTFHNRDRLFLFIFSVLFLINVVGFIRGTAQFTFYPTLSALTFSEEGIISVISFLMLCSLPVVVEIKERMKWRY
mgnify:CR=1 FL=1